jgi:hypothetical protein
VNFEFSLENADKLAAYAIRKEINKKANKRYEQVDEAWLGVHLETELSDERSIDYMLQQFGVPKRHPFKRIFLLHKAGIDRRVIQFFPTWEIRSLKPRNPFVAAILELEDPDSQEASDWFCSDIISSSRRGPGHIGALDRSD